ncbi:MAG: elongation factor P hydroxylase [Pseudomonadales bacterium]
MGTGEMAAGEIAARFNRAFGRAGAGTVLLGGAEEPLYLPATARRPAIIRYTLDYAASALHELAHWLVAGAERRRQVDYGYWYAPPPRDAEAQRRFYQVEVGVQSLELLLATVCGLAFRPSADNPGRDDPQGAAEFASAVEARACERVQRGLSARPAAVLQALEPHWRLRLCDRFEVPAHG